MAQLSLPLDIANEALVDCKTSALIDSPTENSTAAIVCRTKYTGIVLRFLSKNYFVFSQREVSWPTLATNVAPPMDRWSWYNIPQDLQGLVRIRFGNDIWAYWSPGSVQSFNKNFSYDIKKVGGTKYLRFPRRLYSSQGWFLVYSYFNTNPADWPETFRQAIIAELAFKIYSAINEKPSAVYLNFLQMEAVKAKRETIAEDTWSYSYGPETLDQPTYNDFQNGLALEESYGTDLVPDAPDYRQD